jgi:WASH complex subunit 7, C-terminal
VAYLLRVLDLDREFDSLNWFESVQEKYKAEKEGLKEQMSNIKKGDTKLKHTLVLTEKRLDTYEQVKITELFRRIVMF